MAVFQLSENDSRPGSKPVDDIEARLEEMETGRRLHNGLEADVEVKSENEGQMKVTRRKSLHHSTVVIFLQLKLQRDVSSALVVLQ